MISSSRPLARVAFLCTSQAVVHVELHKSVVFMYNPAMHNIVQNGDPVLRATATEVPPADISSPKIQKILRDMTDALEAQEDGVAIAAPQIGVSLRIFVVSHRALAIEREEETGTLAPEDVLPPFGNLVFINPEITKLSKKRHWVPEGCLSVRWLYGKVLRAEKASVRAYDETGKRFTRNGSGLMAQIFQHETDHLNGALFIDKARGIEEIHPEDLRNGARLRHD